MICHESLFFRSKDLNLKMCGKWNMTKGGKRPDNKKRLDSRSKRFQRP